MIFVSYHNRGKMEKVLFYEPNFKYSYLTWKQETSVLIP